MTVKTEINVRYAETDQMKVVHHAVYPIWYEQSRTELIEKLGIKYCEIEKQGVMCPIAELNSKYISPARYGDTVIVEASVSKLTPVKIVFEYKIYRKSDETLLNTGSSVHPWTDTNIKLINLKKAFPKIYDTLLNNINKL